MQWQTNNIFGVQSLHYHKDELQFVYADKDATITKLICVTPPCILHMLLLLHAIIPCLHYPLSHFLSHRAVVFVSNSS